MRFHTAILTATLALSVTTARAEVQVQPIGLQIGSAMLEEMDFSFRPHGVSAGTKVHLLLSGLSQPIVNIDEDNCTLAVATDSTGRNLLEKKQPKNTGGFSMSMSQGPIGPFPRISEDGKQLLVELVMPQPPAAGATAIQLEGSLSVFVSSGTTAVTATDVPLAPGLIQLGDQSMEITKVGPSEWQEGKFDLSIKMTQAQHEAIAAFHVTDAAGTPLTEGPNSTMTMMNTVEVGMSLDSKPDIVTITLDLYDGLTREVVPVTLTIGLGIE